MKPKVLIISDEVDTARVWGYALTEIGLEVRLTGISEPVSEIWAQELPDLIIIEDFNDGMEELPLCRQLRDITAVPILYLTAKQNENFLLDTYRAGADETISFPITPRLFQAKVKAWLRQTQTVPLAALHELKQSYFTFHPDSRKLATQSGEMINLSVLEARLLYILMNSPGRTFEASILIERIWGYYGEGNNNLLKVLIYRLRKKIEPDPGRPRYLLTVGSSGYRFVVPDTIPEN